MGEPREARIQGALVRDESLAFWVSEFCHSHRWAAALTTPCSRAGPVYKCCKAWGISWCPLTLRKDMYVDTLFWGWQTWHSITTMTQLAGCSCEQ